MATQTERREVTRKAILAAARKLFGGDGFATTTIDDIAAGAAVAKGAVYHYFPNKEAVFEAVFEEVSRDVFTQVAAATRKSPDALAAMVTGTRAYFDICAKGAIAQIILQDGPAVLGWARWREIDERYFGAMIPGALKAAMKAGLIETQAIEPLARLLNGAISEAAAACSESDSPALLGRRHAQAMQALLEGLRKQSK